MAETLNLVGCGILKKETQYLIGKHRWPIHTHFVCSALHVDYHRLEGALHKVLQQIPRNAMVVYGTCHPLMDTILTPFHAHRIVAQNCIELLLGNTVFTSDLQNGAFFLLEDWAVRWDFVTKDVFGRTNNEARRILQSAHDHFLCLRTPCSGDFSTQAQTLSERFEIPLKWRDVSLDNLERRLSDLVHQVIGDGEIPDIMNFCKRG